MSQPWNLGLNERTHQSSTRWSALKMDIYRTFYNFADRIYMCVLTINDKGIHKFKRSQGGIFGRIWRQENEGENVVIIL